jgi:preprotein translocase subunit SecY
MTMLTLTTGSAFIMWLGEQISDRGIGNGMSLIIFAGIVVGLPRAVAIFGTRPRRSSGVRSRPIALVALIALMVAVVAFIVFVEGGQRRIPVQYAKRVMGRKVMGGQMTYLPLRVNSGGVIPPIFASSLLTFPQTLALIFRTSRRFSTFAKSMISAGASRSTRFIYVLLIIFFAFFYVGIIFNPTELADNMRKYGGFIPGIRPGTQHLGAHQSHFDALDVRRRRLSGDRLPAAGVDDFRNSPAALVAGRQLVRPHMWRFVLDGL